MKNSNKRVFVGLSGGVDSSVSAALLLQQGYDVTGVFIKVWQPDFLLCDWEEERLSAMRVAAKLKIPFLTFDAEDAYKQQVADYMISEYREGRTPNPDVMCNKAIKFGVFYDFALKEKTDFIATGHYAQIKETGTQLNLLRGSDKDKDQSYFLWNIANEQLEHILFPIGNLKKSHVRELAHKFGLHTAFKEDSQGICFLGNINMKGFLSHYIDYKKGNVLNTDGTIVGTHDGALFYTIGQRKGFHIHNTVVAQDAHFVVEKDIENNTITISDNKPLVSKKGIITVNEPHWISNIPNVDEPLLLQTRYRQTPVVAHVRKCNNKEVILELDESADLPAAGQSAVMYKNDICLGGGIIV